MKRPFAGLYPVLLLSVLSAPLHAQEKDPPPVPAPVAPALSLPDRAVTTPGRLLRLKVETNCKAVVWASGSDRADVLPLRDDGREAVFSSPTPGVYRVIAFGWHADAAVGPVICTVTVEGPAPPGPQPPPPQPPAPSDPLMQALAAAYAAETAPQRGQQLATLVALYRQGVAVAQQPQLKTVGDLFGVLAAAGKAQLGDPAAVLPRVRAAVAAELKRTLPTAAAAPLDAATRQRCAEAFGRVAVALDAVAAVKGKAVKR